MIPDADLQAHVSLDYRFPFRLMSRWTTLRLDSLMPYDEDHGGTDEYRFLLSQVMDGFLAKLERVKNDARPHDALNNVARLCTERSVNCITFNYDDVLDQALAETRFPGSDGWHAKRGYGFYCRDSRGTTGIHWDQNIGERTPMLLLKLHGSINWRPMKGYSEPYVLDAITHHEDWPSDNSLGKEDLLLVERHLESQPLIAPPVLSKASLVRQPVLRVVWSLAYEKLAKARSVTFVGYSFPTTDMPAPGSLSMTCRSVAVGLVGQGQRRAAFYGLARNSPPHKGD